MACHESITFLYNGTGAFSFDALYKLAALRGLGQKMVDMQKAIDQGYKTEYASLALVKDVHLLKSIKQLIAEKKKLNPTVIVVIGIGGSALGAMAIYDALVKQSCLRSQSPRLYFVQTIDSDHMAAMLELLENELIAGHAVLINVVTKSGTTLETVLNFELIRDLLKKYFPNDYARYIVVTSDAGSALHMSALHEGCDYLEIPKSVGGRYSVFSAVGLFPLAFVGIDIDSLVLGAQKIIDRCLSEDIAKNPAALTALLLCMHYQKGVSIHDTFIFSADLESMGKWYRQLMGESIGKEFNVRGERVMVGITPTVSLGTVDLHSVAQLYLGGPKDKFTTFVTVQKSVQEIVTGSDSFFSYTQNKTFTEIIDAFVQGTHRAYQKQDRPFCTFVLPQKNAFFIGQFMQCKMIEMMLLGYLLEVDPFDQPNVESYKQEVKQILQQ